MRFRLAPTPAQEQVLLEHCAHARYVWNLAVEQHQHWRPGRKSAPGYAEQSRQLTEARREFAWLAAGSQTVQLVTRLEDKAPGRVEKVDPAYTSQICHACGHCAAESRESQAVFRCRACGHADHADVNAAKNIAVGRTVTCSSRPTDPDRPPVRGALQPLGGA